MRDEPPPDSIPRDDAPEEIPPAPLCRRGDLADADPKSGDEEVDDVWASPSALGVFGVRDLLMRLVLSAGLWWVIAGGAASSWLLGVPAVAAAAWVSGRLARGPRVRLSLVGFLRFVPFFLWESLRGGVDVALRTLSPTPRVDPVFAHYRTRLTPPAARVFFANCASLLPGTLAADIRGNEIELHVLSRELDLEAELGRLERAVARIFPHDEEPQDD